MEFNIPAWLEIWGWVSMILMVIGAIILMVHETILAAKANNRMGRISICILYAIVVLTSALGVIVGETVIATVFSVIAAAAAYHFMMVGWAANDAGWMARVAISAPQVPAVALYFLVDFIIKKYAPAAPAPTPAAPTPAAPPVTPTV